MVGYFSPISFLRHFLCTQVAFLLYSYQCLPLHRLVKDLIVDGSAFSINVVV